MSFVVAIWAVSHVPTYGGGSDNCFKPPHHHTTSQAIYLKGSGGLEIHFSSQTEPFDQLGGEEIDFDAVFARKYDQTTFDIFVGCGGCVASLDPIVIPRMQLNGYEHGELEPFTGTAYFSVFPKSQRKFNASELLHCDQGHFGIRLVDYHNRTNGEPLVWTAVVGLGERFTFLELLEFPIYILRNHGDTWNNLGWTVWINFIFVAPLTLWLVRVLLKRLGVPVLELAVDWTIIDGRPRLTASVALREVWYELALLGFVGTMWEELVHLVYAQSFVPVGPMLFVGIIGVIIIPNGWGITQVLLAWASMKTSKAPLCGEGCMRCSKASWWAPVEIASGFSMLFIFGAGFYLGPAAVMLASMTRLFELQGVRRSPQPTEQEKDGIEVPMLLSMGHKA